MGAHSQQSFDQALALHRQGRLGDAADLYQAILADAPDHVPSLCCLCLCRIQYGRLDEAAQLGHLACSLRPDSAEAWHGLGNCQAAARDNSAAAVSFGRMLTLRPAFAEGQSNLGNALLALGRLEEARQCFITALNLKPDYAEADYNLGNVLAALQFPREAITHFSRAAAFKPNFAEAYNNLGVTLYRLDRHDAALSPLRRALLCREDYDEASFNLAVTHSGLGDARLAAGDLETAESNYRLTLALDPGHAEGNYGFAICLAARSPMAAISHFGWTLRLRPDFAEAYNNRGTTLQGLECFDEALGHYRAAIALKPDYSHPYNNLASTLQSLDRVEPAVVAYRKATLLAPDDAVALNNMGIALIETGDIKAAFDVCSRAVALAPRRGFFYRTLADTGLVAPDGPLFREIEERARAAEALPETDRMELHFALGKLYGDFGRHQDSFRHLLAGNRLKRRDILYDEAATLGQFDRLRACFTAEALAVPSSAASSALPLFVLGMPRSGTSLVEQILASHPAMFGAGELPDLRRLLDSETGGGFPETILALPAEAMERINGAYLDGLRAKAPTASRIIDKMPANFLLIGLIHRLFPEAGIIHVSRDPLDSCLSSFSKLFAGDQPYCYDLSELGRYYRAYQGLMEHWRQVLPRGRMLELRYESLIADLEGETRRILAYCGLDWDDRCLNFHRTERSVRTASATQVRKPLYTSAIGRWHAYGDLARPLIDALNG